MSQKTSMGVSPGSSKMSIGSLVSSTHSSLHLEDTTEIVRAAIQIVENKVEMKVTESLLHKGEYSGKLAKQQGRVLLGFIYGKRNDACVGGSCNVQPDASNRVTFSRSAATGSFDATLDSCLQRGTLQGSEVHFQTTDICCSILSYDELGTSVGSSHKPTKFKRHYCKFCKKLLTQISRHFRLAHSEEPEVKSAMRMTDRKQRDVEWNKIRLEGDAEYNEGRPPSEKIFVKKPTAKPLTDCVTCEWCKGLYGRREYSRHERRCTNRMPTGQHVTKGVMLRQQEKRDQLLSEKERKLESFFYGMKNDAITGIAKADRATRLLAYYFAQKYSADRTKTNPHQHLRLCGRLLMALKSIDPEIDSFEKALRADRYDMMMEAIHKVAKVERDGTTIVNPSISVQYNHLIKRLTERLMGYYYQKRAGRSLFEQELRTLDDFQKYHLTNFQAIISRKSRRFIVDKRITRHVAIPTQEDTKLFSDYIRKTSDEAEAALKRGFSFNAWLLLGKCLLVQLLLFNRKRLKEISEITLFSYNNRQSISEEQMNFLTFMQKALANQFHVITLRGKVNHKLTVLINNNQIRKMDLFLRHRVAAGVPANNVFLFGSLNQLGHLDAAQIIREFSLKCGAKEPQNLRSTRFRKQLATLSQMLQLSDNEIRQLADFMGHSVETHCRYYRTPEINTQITKMSKLFMIVPEVDPTKFRNKQIDDIDVDEILKTYVQPTAEDFDHENVENLDEADSEIEQAQPGPSTPGRATNRRNVQGTPKKRMTTDALRLYLANRTSFRTSRSKASPSKRRVKVMWSKKEKLLMQTVFKSYLTFPFNKKLPSMADCNKAASKYKADFLTERTGRTIYAWLQGERRRIEATKRQ